MAKDLPSAYWLTPDLQEIIDSIPGGSRRFVKEYERDGKSLAVSFQSLSPDGLKATARFLRARRNEDE